MKKKHNGIISFWKFMFSILMIALHLGQLHPEAKYRFSAGSIGVEFFFIVSGYLFCKKYINKPSIDNEKIGKITIKFLTKKINKFLPYILFLWIISFPYSIITEKYKIYDFVAAFYSSLYMPTKLKIIDIYGITWYIITMIIIQGILFPLINKYKENFIYLASPLIILLTGNYLLVNYGCLAATWEKNTFFYVGIIRGLFGINIGMIIYLISKKIKTINLTDSSKFLLTIMEILGYISIFIIVNKIDAHIRYDYLMVIILTISISISFSEQSLMNTICNNKLFYYLEKLSLPIYLNQWYLIHLTNNIVKKYHPNLSYYKELLIAIIVSIVVAIITTEIINIYNKNKEKILKIFINI